ncbi:MAG: hypothetical protein MI742_09855, partial [Desulfobacterales bacterium]|nr:hypothetical protein [Desulfobacterales bacterium]
GAIHLIAETVRYDGDSGRIHANGGSGGDSMYGYSNGGKGGVGRIRVDSEVIEIDGSPSNYDAFLKISSPEIGYLRLH